MSNGDCVLKKFAKKRMIMLWWTSGTRCIKVIVAGQQSPKGSIRRLSVCATRAEQSRIFIRRFFGRSGRLDW